MREPEDNQPTTASQSGKTRRRTEAEQDAHKRAAGDYIQAVATAALARLPDLAQKWAPGKGKMTGAEWVALNPTRPDNSAGSFSINTVTGKWSDFAAKAGGLDAVSLYRYLFAPGGTMLAAARALAAEIGHSEFGDHARPRPNGAAAPVKAKAEQDHGTWISPVPASAPKPPAEHFQLGKPDLRHEYRDASGALLMYVDRWEENASRPQKEIRPLTLRLKAGRLVWSYRKADDKRWPLYGLDRLKDFNADWTIMISEGEKKTDAGQRLFPDYPHLSLCGGGTGAVGQADLSPLAGRKVVVWPDNDKTGFARARAMAQALAALGCETLVAMLLPAGKPEGWDLANAEAERCWTPGEALAYIKDPANRVPMAEARAREQDQPTPEAGEQDHEPAPAAAGEQDEEPADEGSPGRPKIHLAKGKLMALTLKAESVLLESGADVFQRGGFIVQPHIAKVRAADGAETKSYQLAAVRPAGLRAMLDNAASFQKFDGRTNKWHPADCPAELAEILLSLGRSRLRIITGILTAPTMRADGSILDEPGYDERTGLLYWPGSTEFPKVPEYPTKDEAEAAVVLLQKLLEEFPFVSGAKGQDEAVAISGFCTALVRRSLPAAPMHCISSPSAGSGKSFVIDLIALVATGQRAPVAALSGDPEEDEKRLNSYLLTGDALLSLDNVSAPLGGDRLCQILSQEVVSLRPLGSTAILKAETTIAMFATGNNLAFAGDIFRRCILGRIDPQVERPEEREFQADPMAQVKAERGKYVTAALTLMRAYFVAGRLEPGPALASYEVWCRVVRDALLWLGFANPVGSMASVQASDTSREEAAEVFARWDAIIGASPVSTREVIERATSRHPQPATPEDDADQRAEGIVPGSPVCPEFHAALAAVAAERSGGGISAKRLGWWLKAHADQIIGGRRLTGKADPHLNATAWKVTKT